ncbi:hypothetical protein PINS_up000106 [Pythium insidiosum]|nr:hypothetical protein PINS_up000106 [Pythium insidiosum]
MGRKKKSAASKQRDDSAAVEVGVHRDGESTEHSNGAALMSDVNESCKDKPCCGSEENKEVVAEVISANDTVVEVTSDPSCKDKPCCGSLKSKEIVLEVSSERSGKEKSCCSSKTSSRSAIEVTSEPSCKDEPCFGSETNTGAIVDVASGPSCKDKPCCSSKAKKEVAVEVAVKANCKGKACCGTDPKQVVSNSSRHSQPAAEKSSCCGSTGSKGCGKLSGRSSSNRGEASAHNGPGSTMSDRLRAYKSNREHRAVATPVIKGSTPSRMSMKAQRVETVRLVIGGMTCSGCCTRIEVFMKQQPGIFGVNVSLLSSRGTFEYDPATISETGVAQLVAALGFTPSIMPSESLVSLVLHIGRELPSRAKQLLTEMDGVAAVHVKSDGGAREDQRVVVDYDPEILGARTLVRRLSSAMGIQVQVSTPRPQALQNHEVEVREFARLLAWSVLFACPVIFLEYIVPLFGCDGDDDRSFSCTLSHLATTEVLPGLSVDEFVGLLCATPILFIIARPIHDSALSALRYSSRVTMDVLISLSATCAYVFSVVTVLLQVIRMNGTGRVHDGTSVTNAQPNRLAPQEETFFEVTCLLVTLILLGRYIEKIVKAKAARSVDSLLKMQAKTAILLETKKSDSQLVSQPTSDELSAMVESYIDVLLVERGDLLKVLPGARVPTDGVVIDGSSRVDESMITGEARKVEKEVGSIVIGGTINAHGVLVVRVTHTINESMLARIVHLVDDAQALKSRTEGLADAVSSYFTTFIICVALVAFCVWYQLARHGTIETTHGMAPFPFALRFAITVLVISCPCAISLAVPTAMMVATTMGSRVGVLFKGGIALETLHDVDVVMFDKTGTLTSGKLEVVDFIVAQSRLLPAEINHPRRLWTLLAAAERDSEHSVAQAIRTYAKKVHTPDIQVDSFEALPGCGVRCRVDRRHTVCVGSVKWMLDVLRVDVPLDLAARNESYQREGCVVVCLAVDGLLCALVALQDTPRPEARAVVEELRARRIQTWIVTGDQRETALAVAESLGIPDVTVIADALPPREGGQSSTTPGYRKACRLRWRWCK